MAYSVERHPEKSYISVSFDGDATHDEHDEARQQTVDALIDTGWKHLLIDTRTIFARLYMLDDFQFMAEPLCSTRVAVLYRPEETQRFAFMEHVAANRGANFKAFTEPDDALQWLFPQG